MTLCYCTFSKFGEGFLFVCFSLDLEPVLENKLL